MIRYLGTVGQPSWHIKVAIMTSKSITVKKRGWNHHGVDIAKSNILGLGRSPSLSTWLCGGKHPNKIGALSVRQMVVMGDAGWRYRFKQVNNKIY